MKKRYNLIVREYNKMDISKIEEYTIQVETDDIDFTIEQYCRNRHVENLTAELILEDDDYSGPNKSYGV